MNHEPTNPSNQFATDFSIYELVGFHGTSAHVSSKIETVGFLPDKVLSRSDHDDILKSARALDISTNGVGDYEEWLRVYSVTFTWDSQAAVTHVKGGNSGGQGLRHVLRVANQILARGNDQHKKLAQDAIAKVQTARSGPAIVYAVDLSNLGPRLDQSSSNRLFQYRWHPDAALPSISEISPSRLIARLEVK